MELIVGKRAQVDAAQRLASPRFSVKGAAAAVVGVGPYGRGVVLERLEDRVVVTAARCLPELPDPNPFSYLGNRTYPRMIGPLERHRTVWVECLFADPVTDIAVLAAPDDDQLYAQWQRYQHFVRYRTSGLRIARPTPSGSGWYLNASRTWMKCTWEIKRPGGRMTVRAAAETTFDLPAGSPVLSEHGRVVGLVSGGAAGNPVPITDLPARLLPRRRTERAC